MKGSRKPKTKSTWDVNFGSATVSFLDTPCDVVDGDPMVSIDVLVRLDLVASSLIGRGRAGSVSAAWALGREALEELGLPKTAPARRRLHSLHQAERLTERIKVKATEKSRQRA